MIKDKYSALWLSYSSITDYLKCPRSYFLKNIYRSPNTRRKIQIIQPALALGQTIHEVIDKLSVKPHLDRLKQPLDSMFLTEFAKISGKKGGFTSKAEEMIYQKRGEKMIQRIINNPGPLNRKAIKIRQDLPYIWLDDKENIILCGKIDWLEYFEDTDSLGILDFKTGKSDEDPDSLQLRIYHLIVKNIQKRPITKASYWYLDRDDNPIDVELPDLNTAKADVLEIAKKIELARKLEHFTCKRKTGCFACQPYEDIIVGKGEYVGMNAFSQDIYII